MTSAEMTRAGFVKGESATCRGTTTTGAKARDHFEDLRGPEGPLFHGRPEGPLFHGRPEGLVFHGRANVRESFRGLVGQGWNLMGQAELPPGVLFGETEMDLWPYRRHTVALLRRYARASVEAGRLPSLLGREFFRSRVMSSTRRNFEDVVIFVADMERAIEKLTALDKKLLAMNILEEYSIPEVARLLGYPQRTVERSLQDALDQLSRILLAGDMMETLPASTNGGVDSDPWSKSCQEGKSYNFDVSDSKDGKYKRNYHLHKPSGNCAQETRVVEGIIQSPEGAACLLCWALKGCPLYVIRLPPLRSYSQGQTG
jgi:Sigma-70, region 4